MSQIICVTINLYHQSFFQLLFLYETNCGQNRRNAVLKPANLDSNYKKAHSQVRAHNQLTSQINSSTVKSQQVD